MQIETITFNEYPYLLKQINNPPNFLDIAGTKPPDDYKYLCVIGARRYSRYGAEVCRHLIAGLKGFPIVIVSGLALGIDSIAHESALANNILTIAFPGSGLNEKVIYPRCHINLARRIISAGGALLSPFKEKQSSQLWTFPARNRLMAGISHATLIIEGKKGSGTLLTADYALDFGRDVLIVPGSIFSDLSYGPHMLYKRGATPITSSNEILEILGFQTYKKEESPPSVMLDLFSTSHSWSPNEMLVLKALQFSPANATELIEKTGLQALDLNMAISNLELEDAIYQDNDQYYSKNHNA